MMTPKEFFEHPELLDVLLPLLKNDFRINESYKFRNGKINAFDFDISIFIGKDEELSAEQIHGWRQHTSKLCSVYYFEGEHFFLNTHFEYIVNIINNTLNGGINVQ